MNCHSWKFSLISLQLRRLRKSEVHSQGLALADLTASRRVGVFGYTPQGVGKLAHLLSPVVFSEPLRPDTFFEERNVTRGT
jgi:hypothetical protein